jgi:hypothetical protein
MEQDDAIYVKISGKLKRHVNQYVTQKPVKGGVSALVRELLIKKTKFKDNHLGEVGS